MQRHMEQPIDYGTEDVELPAEDTDEGLDFENGGEPDDVADPGEIDNPDETEDELEDPSGELFEFDIDTANGTRTEKLSLEEIGEVLQKTDKLLDDYNALREEYDRSKDVVGYINRDNFSRTLLTYRLQGHSPREIITNLYEAMESGLYNPDEPEVSQPEEQTQTPEGFELPKVYKEKLEKFDNYLSMQEQQEIIGRNMTLVEDTRKGLGYVDMNPSDEKFISDLLRDVTVEYLKENYPDITPQDFLKKRTLSASAAKSIWREVAARSGGKVRANRAKAAATAPPKQEREERAKPKIRRAVQAGSRPAPVRQVGAQAGAGARGGAQPQPQRSSPTERAAKLREMIYGNK